MLAVGHVVLVDVDGNLAILAAGRVGHRSKVELFLIVEIIGVDGLHDALDFLVGQLRHVVDERAAVLRLARVDGIGLRGVRAAVLFEARAVVLALPPQQILGAHAGGGTGGAGEHEHVVQEVDLGVTRVGTVLHLHRVHRVVVVVPQHRRVLGAHVQIPLEIRLDEGGAQHVLRALGALTARLYLGGLHARLLHAVSVGIVNVLVAQKRRGAGVVRHGAHKAHLAFHGLGARAQLVLVLGGFALVAHVPGARKARGQRTVFGVGHLLGGVPAHLAVDLLTEVVGVQRVGVREVGQALMVVLELHALELVLLPLGGIDGLHRALLVEVQIRDIETEDNGIVARLFQAEQLVAAAHEAVGVAVVGLQGKPHLLARLNHVGVQLAVHRRAAAHVQVGVQVVVGKHFHRGERRGHRPPLVREQRRTGLRGEQQRGCHLRVLAVARGRLVSFLGRRLVGGLVSRLVGRRIVGGRGLGRRLIGRLLDVRVGRSQRVARLSQKAGGLGLRRLGGLGGLFGFLLGLFLGIGHKLEAHFLSRERRARFHALGIHHAGGTLARSHLHVEHRRHRVGRVALLREGHSLLGKGGSHVQRAALAGVDGAVLAGAGQLDAVIGGHGVGDGLAAQGLQGGGLRRIDGGDLLVGEARNVQHDDAALAGHAHKGVLLAGFVGGVHGVLGGIGLGLAVLVHLIGHEDLGRHAHGTRGVHREGRTQGEGGGIRCILGNLVAHEVGQVADTIARARAGHSRARRRGGELRRSVITLVDESVGAGSTALQVAVDGLRGLGLVAGLPSDRCSGSEGMDFVSIVYGYGRA